MIIWNYSFVYCLLSTQVNTLSKCYNPGMSIIVYLNDIIHCELKKKTKHFRTSLVVAQWIRILWWEHSWVPSPGKSPHAAINQSMGHNYWDCALQPHKKPQLLSLHTPTTELEHWTYALQQEATMRSPHTLQQSSPYFASTEKAYAKQQKSQPSLK